MTIFRRTQHHSSETANNGSLALETPEKTSKMRRRIKKRRWSFPQQEQVEDWIFLAACGMVLLVCTFWFLGKVFYAASWALPALDSLMDTFASISEHNGSRQRKIHEMAFNPHYKIPYAHSLVGDRSNHYALLRQDIDLQLPENPERSLQRVRELQQHDINVFPTIPLDHNSDQLPKPAYDIYNCPETPPPNYPFQWSILRLIENWNPEDTNIPDSIYNGLCIFDYQRDHDKAMTYRNAEVPFVVQNDPRIAATAERWNAPGYMQRLLGDVPHRTTRSDTNHFLYAVPPAPTGRTMRRRNKFAGRTVPPGWKEPTESMRMTFDEWLTYANVTDDKTTPDQPHWYYRLIGCGLTGSDGSCDRGSSEYLFDELPFFQPTPGGLYLREAEMQKGIHCRFGMKNIIADNHFDAGRNTIVVLGGSRRYMLASPDQCTKMALYPHGHPSARHSIVNWSAPDLEQFPEFGEAMANEVVLQSGDALYLPNNW